MNGQIATQQNKESSFELVGFFIRHSLKKFYLYIRRCEHKQKNEGEREREREKRRFTNKKKMKSDLRCIQSRKARAQPDI